MFAASGCATVVKKEEILARACQIKAAAVKTATPETVKITVPKESIFSAKERLVYKARVFGIPIGEFIAVNKGLTDFNGRPAYCFELTVHTLPFFGDIKDRYVAYIDADEFVVLRHEEYIKGKRGEILESAVDFDYQKGVAFYKNAVSKKEKQIAIPGKIHDIATGGFYLRTVPMAVGDTVELNVYADEKIYNYFGYLHSKTDVKVPGQGWQEAELLRSYLFLDGKPVKGISADVFLSTAEYRMPLRAVLRTFFGSISVVLK